MDDKDRTLKALEDMKESMAYAVRRKQQIGHEAVPIVNGGASTEDGGTPSAYADTLNALHDMQHSMAYAVRRPVLAAAERAIIELERERDDLRETAREYLRILGPITHSELAAIKKIAEHHFATPDWSENDPDRNVCRKCGMNLTHPVHKRFDRTAREASTVATKE